MERDSHIDIPENPKKTIAVLGENMGYYIPKIIFNAIRERLAQTGYNLLYFAADAYKAPFLYESQPNILYNFISPELVDGVIINSNSLGVHSTRQEFFDLCAGFRPLPMVSIGMELEYASNVQLDNAAGMYEAVTHLIEVHGYTKIAFLGGQAKHPDVIARFAAFKRALSEHEIPVDSGLVFEGNFTLQSGNSMVGELLDERKKEPGRDVEAVVCCNDYMASGVLLELQNRGISIPEEIALIGFDDIPFTDCITPPISTIKQPFDALAVQAVEILLRKIQGDPVPGSTYIESLFVPRRSCGCTYSPEIENQISIPKEIDELIKSAPDKFLLSLNEQIIAADTPTVMAWKQTLAHLGNKDDGMQNSAIRKPNMERLEQTQVLLGRAAYNTFYSEKFHEFLFYFGVSLKETFRMSEFLETLRQKLPDVGIKRCCLCLYENPERAAPGDLPKWSRMIMAFDRDNYFAAPEMSSRFETSRLIPPEYPGAYESRNWIVLPLYFQNEQLGFALMDSEIINEKFFFHLLIQINCSLKGTLLFQENQDHLNKLAIANDTIREFNKKLENENLRMNMEMEVARKIQTALLPSAVGGIHPDFNIVATTLPTDEVGGDYYDVLLDREKDLWLGIGDVSGHGLKPGMIMMMTQTIQTAITASYSLSPRDAVIILNRALVKNVAKRMGDSNYMSCTLLKYAGKGIFQYAGMHLDLLLYRRKTKSCDCIETGGTWLNLVEDIEGCTENLELKLETGDILVLYTDGITESKNKNHLMLGCEGLRDLVLKHGEKPVENMHGQILEDVKNRNHGQFRDDLTLVLVQRIR